jgi:hypothetical protein
MRMAGANDGSFGREFLAAEWGEWALPLARACTTAANDIAAEAAKARVERVYAMRGLCHMVGTRPATPAASLTNIELCVGTGQMILMLAALLIQVPPERRAEWLQHIHDKAVETLGQIAALEGVDPTSDDDED